MKTYFITRFSILDPESNSWVISRGNKNYEQLKSMLFSESRLSEKIWTFKNITYKSIINQTNDNYNWLIYTSNELPERYKIELNEIASDKIKVIEVENQNEFFKKIQEFDYGIEYSTVRLDDDDALNPLFIEKINEIYLNTNSKIISFPNGIKITKKDDQIYSENEKFCYKKIAIGLTMFNDNIYLSGNHVLIDQKYQVLYDETPNMYLIYSSENCDTKRNFNFNNCNIFDLDIFLKNK